MKKHRSTVVSILGLTTNNWNQHAMSIVCYIQLETEDDTSTLDLYDVMYYIGTKNLVKLCAKDSDIGLLRIL